MVAELSLEVWWSNTYSENASFVCLLKRQRAVVLLSFSSCWDSARRVEKVDKNSPVRDPRTGNSVVNSGNRFSKDPRAVMFMSIRQSCTQ